MVNKMYLENEFMNSREQLVAFLDGELPAEDTSTLFYELANNPELQEEMRQYVLLRNTLRNSQLKAPDALRINILKNTGLYKSPLTSFFDSSAKIATMLLALFFNKTTFSVILVMLLGATTFFILNNNENPNSIISKSNNGKSEIVNNSKIPISSSAIINENNNIVDNNKSNLFTDRSSDKNTKTYISKNSNNHLNNISSNLQNSNISSDLSNNVDIDNNMNNIIIHIVDNANFINQNYFLLSKDNKVKFLKINYIDNDIFSDIMKNAEIRIKKYSLMSSNDFQLKNENNPIINDISLELKYNFDSKNSLGIVYGLENFRMIFDKDIDGVIFRYNQSWDASWLALNYHYNIGDLLNTGIMPEINLLAGATTVGPLFRAGLGLNYYINDNLYINTGFESALLVFKESQANNNSKWFSLNKYGWNIGFGVGF